MPRELVAISRELALSGRCRGPKRTGFLRHDMLLSQSMSHRRQYLLADAAQRTGWIRLHLHFRRRLLPSQRRTNGRHWGRTRLPDVRVHGHAGRDKEPGWLEADALALSA